jgi:prevent-host-death family protein
MLMMMFSSRIVCLEGFYYDDHVNSYAKDVAVSHSYSIAEAKSHLSTAVHRAETGEIVHITRRGKAVAVLLSEGAYERIAHFRGSEED